ncbi:PIN domain protein [Bacteroidales bacterium Barb6XT]|nr:PIN domain protein [Bacteroidales bacterium Barb6XT]
MNGIRIMCDTNPLIYLLDGNKDVAGFLENKQLYVSVITELELFGKRNLSKQDNDIIGALLDSCFVIDLNQEIKQIYKRFKQKYVVKLPDAIIAATAIYLDMPLLTFDQGFKNIPELQLMLWEW